MILDKTSNTTLTALSLLHCLHNNHPLSLVSKSYRNKSSAFERPIHTNNQKRSPISHFALQQPSKDGTYEK